MYKATYINPLVQFGRSEYTLVLVDDAGVMPTLRQQCSFTPDQLAQMQAIAESAITAATKDFNDGVIRRWVDERISATGESVKAAIVNIANSQGLNAVAAADSIVNPILEYYGLPTSSGLAPLIDNKVADDINKIVNAWHSLPVSDASVPTTIQFIQSVTQSLGIEAVDLTPPVLQEIP